MDRRHFMGGIVDRVEVGRVTRQEEQLGAGAADQLANRLALMAAEVVHDDNVTGAEGGDQELFDVSAEAGAVDRPVDDAGGGDPVAMPPERSMSASGRAAAWRSGGCHVASARGGGSYWS